MVGDVLSVHVVWYGSEQDLCNFVLGLFLFFTHPCYNDVPIILITEEFICTLFDFHTCLSETLFFGLGLHLRLRELLFPVVSLAVPEL